MTIIAGRLAVGREQDRVHREGGGGFARVTGLLATTALWTGMAAPALAQAVQEITVDDERNETLRSSTADNGNPADIVVTNEGSVVVDEGRAVILDSDNRLDSAGILRSDGDMDAAGVLVETGNGIDSGLVNSGQIDIIPDVDSVDIPDTGPNFGIRLTGEGPFTGDIVNDTGGQIAVGGRGSIGLDLGVPVTGTVENRGQIALDGPESIGVRIGGALTGDFVNSGQIQASSRGDETGILVEAPVSGRIRNLGTVTSGRNSFFNQDFDLVAGSGRAALDVRADIGGGILNGPVEQGGDDGAGAALASNNAPITLLVTSQRRDGGAADVDIGAVGAGDDAFAIVNRAAIDTTNDAQGVDGTAIRVEGGMQDGQIFRTVLEGGIRNTEGGAINVNTSDGVATAISIGDFATVPEIRNGGNITVRTQVFRADTNFDGENDIEGTGADAFGIAITENATVERIANSGVIDVGAAGLDSTATGILDLSGAVTAFDNSGNLLTSIGSGSSGSTIAADFSRATGDFLLTNSGNIVGDVLLGAGNDLAAMAGGVHVGDLDFGGGMNRFELSGGAQFVGTIRGTAVDLVSVGSIIGVNANDPSFLRSASLSGGSTLLVDIGRNPDAAGGLSVADTLSLSADTTLDPNFTVFPEVADPIVLASAGTLDIDGGIDALGVQLGLSSVVFEQALSLQTGERDELVIELRRKSAEEIGLQGQNALIFEAAAAGLVTDDTLGPAIANIDSVETLETALDQLRPQFSEVPRFVAVNAQNMALGGMRARLSSRRDMAERARADSLFEGSPVADEFRIKPGQWSVFLQEIGTIADRDASPGVRGYDGHSFGFLAGIDRSMLGLDVLGLSAMVSLSDFDDDGFNDQDFEILTTQATLYGGLTFLGGFFFDFLGSFAFHDIEREHTIQFADFSRRVSADWDATQIGGSANLGYQLDLGESWHARLAGLVNYTELDEDGYSENAGENATGFVVDDRDSSSLRAGGNIELAGTFDVGDETQLRTRLTGGYLSELDDDFVTTTARFGEAGERFSLAVPVTQDDSIFGGLNFAVITRSIIVNLSYDAEIADDFFAHTGSLSVRLTF